MPTYEYRCEKCQAIFEIVQSMAEHERGKVVCPHCQSKQIVQQFSSFFAKTSKKS
jgi:putative FmdB family regulatory protein